jgi:hypothetical protein
MILRLIHFTFTSEVILYGGNQSLQSVLQHVWVSFGSVLYRPASGFLLETYFISLAYVLCLK